jgi:hypothetical protein
MIDARNGQIGEGRGARTVVWRPSLGEGEHDDTWTVSPHQRVKGMP